MRCVTGAEMRALEAEAAQRGVPESQLMATAGLAIAEAARTLLGPVDAGAITLALVGRGNNGGDALVAAAHLLADGRRVLLWTAPGRSLPPPVPAAALAAETLASIDDLRSALPTASVVLDGLYGIGLGRPPSGEVAAAIVAVNASRTASGPYVLAIDLPSGIMADTGVAPGVAIAADETLMLGHPKLGLYQGAGARATGRLALKEIGLPPATRTGSGPTVITSDIVRSLLPTRAATADKWEAGAVVVVGGALEYPGAPRLAALGAMRTGAGYVTLAVPRSIYGVVAGSLLEATYLPLPETDGDLGESAATALAKQLNRYRAMVLGPGLGRERGIAAFIERLLNLGTRARSSIGFGGAATPPTTAPLLPADMRLVMDADALSLVAQLADWAAHLPAQTVLTPNVREMAKLTGKATEEIEAKAIAIAQVSAKSWGRVVVLKHGHSVVAAPDGATWLAEQAEPALATAGSGDVLAGIIGALLAQGLAPAEAAVVGVHLGQAAARRGVVQFGMHGLVAGDLPPLVAEAMAALVRGES